MEVRETDVFKPRSRRSRIIPIAEDVWEALASVRVEGACFIVAAEIRRKRKDSPLSSYPHPGDDWIIDPEALLLATTRFGRHDSRLMDESIDWLAKFGRRISLQRLQSLHRSWPGVADSRVLAAIAEVLGQQTAHRKWRVISDPAPEVSAPESFFIRSDGAPGILIGDAEPVFAKHGLLRGKLELRGMSKPPDPRTRENLIFTLRALLGVNARAEILGWLLTHDSGHPAAIARSTGYFSKSIQQILNEMEESAQVLSIRHGREKHFRVRAKDWQFMLPPPAEGQSAFPRWVDWMPLFAAITRLAETLALPGIDDKSEHFQAIKLREALDEAMPALVRAGVSHELRSSRDQRGADLVQSLLADLNSLLGHFANLTALPELQTSRMRPSQPD